LAREVHDALERKVLGLVGRDAVAGPGRRTEDADPAVRDGSLERLEGGAEPPLEVCAAEVPERLLGVVEEVDVRARDAEVPEALGELVLEEAGRHRVISVAG